MEIAMRSGKSARWFGAGLAIAAVAVGLVLALAWARQTGGEDGRAEKKAGPSAKGRVVKNGLAVDFSIASVAGAAEGEPLRVGDFAEVKFRLTDPGTGAPAATPEPAAWMDIGDRLPAPGHEKQDCKEKVALYLKGMVGIRPMIDLNGYYLLVLNHDPSISVIDPVVSMTGMTSLYATAVLDGSPADWTRSGDGKRLYVSMPGAGKVAVVDTDTFRVAANVAAGRAPTRVLLQPDGRYLWVGDDSDGTGEGGAVVIDTVKLETAARLPTGSGHHEIAFAENRYAFVTNRKQGTVSVVDVALLKKVKDLATGPAPLAIAWSPLSRQIYVADGKEGTVAVIDTQALSIVGRIALRPGLGPMRFSPDGRFGFVVNTSQNAVHVVDAADNQLLHTIPMPGQPYQVAFTRAFAYVRLLDSENVQMVNLTSLGAGKQPIVKGFAVGTMAPKLAGDLSIADSITPASTEAAVFVTDPAESHLYYYMEGMNGPMGNFGNYGHRARAGAIADRSMRQVEPGVYSGTIRIPAAGRYDVAFLSQSPPLVHCFSVEAKEDPNQPEKRQALEIKYLDPLPAVAAGTVPLRFTLSNGSNQLPRKGIDDALVRYFLVPGVFHREVPAREVEAGVYEAPLELAEPGAYYVYVSVRSLEIKFGDLPFRTVHVEPPGDSRQQPRVDVAAKEDLHADK